MKQIILIICSLLVVGCSSCFIIDREVYTLSIEERTIIESLYGKEVLNTVVYIDNETQYRGYYIANKDYICIKEDDRLSMLDTLIHEYCHVYQSKVLNRVLDGKDRKYYIPQDLSVQISVEQEATLVCTVAKGNRNVKYLQYLSEFMKIDVDNVF